MHPRFATYRCFGNRIMREAHGSFARFFNFRKRTAGEAAKFGRSGVELLDVVGTAASNAVNQRRKRAN